MIQGLAPPSPQEGNGRPPILHGKVLAVPRPTRDGQACMLANIYSHCCVCWWPRFGAPPVVVVVVVGVVVGVLVGMVALVLLSAHTTNSIFLPANSSTFCLLICPHNNPWISSKLQEADAFKTRGENVFEAFPRTR